MNWLQIAIGAVAALFLAFIVWLIVDTVRANRRFAKMEAERARRKSEADAAIAETVRKASALRSQQLRGQEFFTPRPIPPRSRVFREHDAPPRPPAVRAEPDAPEMFVPLVVASIIAHDRPSTPSEVGDEFRSGGGGDFGGAGASGDWSSGDSSSSSSSSDSSSSSGSD